MRTGSTAATRWPNPTSPHGEEDDIADYPLTLAREMVFASPGTLVPAAASASDGGLARVGASVWRNYLEKSLNIRVRFVGIFTGSKTFAFPRLMECDEYGRGIKKIPHGYEVWPTPNRTGTIYRINVSIAVALQVLPSPFVTHVFCVSKLGG
ncbi:hypothetical protein DFH07DRAFT_766681 [Mycena maculata]|uniref:Uncharacterized protein n=1 Tax=Mycena maculata TaxID=230809 RepID=A0AAD7K4I7_9AGAR|nr:hypothetical protein DFH07DRAFT_766681 [Mycena maculata]